MDRDYIALIKSYEVKGSKYGLNRVRAVLAMLKHPDESLKIIHVAGTNGKGSTCMYLTEILLQAGKRVGTFTSPEVYTYEDKFLLDGKPAPTETLNAYLGKTYGIAMAMDDKPTAFEIETAAALDMFRSEGSEYVVFECGLGGLTDSTNAIMKKELAVITSVSLEHTALLGNTVLEICKQKAGIIKDCPAIVSALQQEDALEYFRSLGCKITDTPQCLFRGQTYRMFGYGSLKYRIHMQGDAQMYNAALAIECAAALGIGYKAISDGLENMKLPGRVEIVSADRTYVLDGSHNPASFGPLMDTLQEMQGRKSLVFGCLADKDVSAAADVLKGKFEEVVLVSPHSYRAMDMSEMKNAFEKRFPIVCIADNIGAALQKVQNTTVVVCGTFTILKEAKEWINKR